MGARLVAAQWTEDGAVDTHAVVSVRFVRGVLNHTPLHTTDETVGAHVGVVTDGLLVRSDDQPRRAAAEWATDGEGADLTVDEGLRFEVIEGGRGGAACRTSRVERL
jgi:hypothetical protein